MDISSIKSRAKSALKGNYWSCVLVAFIISVLTMTSTGTAANHAQSAGNAQSGGEVAEALNALSQSDRLALAGFLLGSVSVIVVVSILLRIFLFNPLQVGGYRFFRRNAAGQKTPVGVVGEGFGNYGHTFGTLLLRDVFLFLWSLLFLIPGIVKGYSYMLVPYLIKDHPELSAGETITRSKELMNGHKWQAFVLDLSFIGWFLLGAITLNIVNIFWTNPYHENARARFYLDLLGE